MQPEVLKALKDSIAHWYRMKLDPIRLYKSTGENPDDKWCALCRIFIQECAACPVSKKTGFTLCKCSPYGEAARAWAKIVDGGHYGGAIWTSLANMIVWKTLAQAEIDFLESLLPVEEVDGG